MRQFQVQNKRLELFLGSGIEFQLSSLSWKWRKMHFSKKKYASERELREKRAFFEVFSI